MTNLERLTLELGNKNYYTDDIYSEFLEENGLRASNTYDKGNKKRLLESVVAVLESLCNNIELYMNISTEFTNTSSAYENLQARIDKINKQILQIKTPFDDRKTITYLFHN